MSTEHKASDWKFLHPILDHHGLKEVILPLSQCPHGNSSNGNFPAESKGEALGLFNHIEHVPHCQELQELVCPKSLLPPFQKRKMRRKGKQNYMQSWGSTGTPSFPASHATKPGDKAPAFSVHSKASREEIRMGKGGDKHQIRWVESWRKRSRSVHLMVHLTRALARAASL